MTKSTEPSGVEKVKAASDGLRGSLQEELANPLDHFDEDAALILKHHGMYQQDNRDLRGAKDAQGNRLGKVYSLMVRVKIPGGRLSAEQLVAQLDLCDELGNGTARITDRQDIQLHGILKRNVREAIRRLNQAQLTTLGACGDVVRNVLCCPAPFRNDAARGAMQELASRVSNHLLPRTRAYQEIWLGETTPPDKSTESSAGPDVQSDNHDVEPIYGNVYLPRKFKIAFGLVEDNCVDAYANDVGFLAIRSGNRQIAGYNVVVGGGFGVTPSNKRTFPAVAQPVAFVQPDEVIDLATAVVKVFRDFGNRSDRKRARLKYLIADWGLDRFKAKLEEYLGRRLTPPDPQDAAGCEDHLGWHEQGDGRWFFGLFVENGRIADRDGFRLKSALREICRIYRPGIMLTPQQNILFSDISSEDRSGLEAILRDHGVKLPDEVSLARRWSMACVALPTCGLAITEAERVLPGIMDQLEIAIKDAGLEGEIFTVRMTGCPNGCARPYNADIGLVGKTLGKYTIFLGGRLLGNRLAYLFKDLVPQNEIVPTLAPILKRFKAERLENETLGDFCYRVRAM